MFKKFTVVDSISATRVKLKISVDEMLRKQSIALIPLQRQINLHTDG